MKTVHEKSRFIFNAHTMTLVEGKAPTRDGQKKQGEDTNGIKMELVGVEDPLGLDWVAYWGWS